MPQYKTRKAKSPEAITVTLPHTDSVGIAGSRPRRIVHVSDTHGAFYENIPAGDILVHSGDFSNSGHDSEIAVFRHWLKAQPHPWKVVVIGNHELGFDQCTREEIENMIFRGVPGRCVLLLDSAEVVDGVKFYGASWNNIVGQAFGATQERREEAWRHIPADTQVLVTHNPAWGVLDLAYQASAGEYQCDLCRKKHRNHAHWGCWPLRQRIDELRIPVHLSGHVHDTPGIQQVEATVYSNAAMDMVHKPCVLNLLGVVGEDRDVDDDVPDASGGGGDKTPAQKQQQRQEVEQHNRLPPAVPITVAEPNDWSRGRCPVLDVDSGDATGASLCLWQELSPPQPNQRWSIVPGPDVDVSVRDGVKARTPSVILVAACAVDGRRRALALSPDGRSVTTEPFEGNIVLAHGGRELWRLAPCPLPPNADARSFAGYTLNTITSLAPGQDGAGNHRQLVALLRRDSGSGATSWSLSLQPASSSSSPSSASSEREGVATTAWAIPGSA